jgi:hypothetical protein
MIDDSDGTETYSIILRCLVEIEGVSWINVVTIATQ